MSRSFPILVIAILIALTACTGNSTTTSRNTDRFSNVLVIGIAGDYESRARFERILASRIRQSGADAAPYYSIVGGNKPIIREDIVAAVDEHDFDAVLVVRRVDSNVELKVEKSRTETDATPIGGRFVNLFRSDYTDYTTPESINVATSALLVVELYSAATEEIVYTFDHQTRSETNLGLLIEETAASVARRLESRKLLAN